MERLTKRLDDGKAYGKWASGVNYMEKLADYEDTGLTPTMVLDTIKARDMAQKQALENAHIVDDYRQAEEQGLLLRLPCKEGDAVFEPIDSVSGQSIRTGVVQRFELKNGNIKVITSLGMFNAREFGKSVFLREEELVAKMQKG